MRRVFFSDIEEFIFSATRLKKKQPSEYFTDKKIKTRKTTGMSATPEQPRPLRAALRSDWTAGRLVEPLP